VTASGNTIGSIIRGRNFGGSAECMFSLRNTSWQSFGLSSELGLRIFVAADVPTRTLPTLALKLYEASTRQKRRDTWSMKTESKALWTRRRAP
jgi:hypothetical protein